MTRLVVEIRASRYAVDADEIVGSSMTRGAQRSPLHSYGDAQKLPHHGGTLGLMV
jgi:hypothetical protein